MTITEPELINDIQGALQKLTDANEKLCEVYRHPRVAEDDLLLITRCLNHIAQAKQDASRTLPPEP